MSTSHAPAARPRARIMAHARLEAKNLLTNGEQIMVALLLPALLFLALMYIPMPSAGKAPTVPPLIHAVASTAATAVIATSMTSQAISTGFDRRAGVLRWIATTPLGRSGYLAGKLLALGIIHVLQAVALGLLALLFGWQPTLAELALSIPVWIIGAMTFGAFGLYIAGTLRAEAVLALSNIIFLLLVALGGIAIPAQSLPEWLAPVISLLPSAALMDALTATLSGGLPHPVTIVLLLAWGVLFTFLTSRFFKWTSA